MLLLQQSSQTDSPTFHRLAEVLCMTWQVPSTMRASRPFSCSAKLLSFPMRRRQYSSSVSGPSASPGRRGQ
jgi:hypothetical protein